MKSKKTAPLPDVTQQRGMTLIEVLVTLVLISVGLLGIAALQLTSLRSNQEAYVRSQASALAGDILDRMRSNQAGALNGDYVTGATAVAAEDLTAWRAAILAALPGAPTGTIALNGRVVTVTITWGERGDFANKQLADNFVTFRTQTEI